MKEKMEVKGGKKLKWYKCYFYINAKVPVMAHPVPVAIPTTPAAGPPFPSFVTGAPTAYVIPTTAMLQPMIPGPAFFSLTSLPTVHASGLPPVSCPAGPHIFLRVYFQLINQWLIFCRTQHMHHNNYHLQRQSEMSSLPVSYRSDVKKKKKSSTIKTEEKRHHRRSRGSDGVGGQPEVKSDRLQFTTFGSVPTQPPQQLTQPQQSDVESMVSGYIYTGMDRDMAEEFILHSMTFQQPDMADSVHSGNAKRDGY